MHTPADLEMTSFRLIKRFLVDAMLKDHIYHPQIGNLLIQNSNRIINIPVQHDARAYGRSGYSFRRLAKDLMYDITSHTNLPMLVVRDIGIFGFLFTIILAVVFLIRYCVYGNTVEGWTSLMLVLLLGISMIMISLGVIGMYLVNILNEVKKLPLYTVRQKDI